MLIKHTVYRERDTITDNILLFVMQLFSFCQHTLMSEEEILHMCIEFVLHTRRKIF